MEGKTEVLDTDAGLGYGYNLQVVANPELKDSRAGLDILVQALTPASDGSLPVHLEVVPVTSGKASKVDQGYANEWIRAMAKLSAIAGGGSSWTIFRRQCAGTRWGAGRELTVYSSSPPVQGVAERDHRPHGRSDRYQSRPMRWRAWSVGGFALRAFRPPWWPCGGG